MSWCDQTDGLGSLRAQERDRSKPRFTLSAFEFRIKRLGIDKFPADYGNGP